MLAPGALLDEGPHRAALFELRLVRRHGGAAPVGHRVALRDVARRHTGRHGRRRTRPATATTTTATVVIRVRAAGTRARPVGALVARRQAGIGGFLLGVRVGRLAAAGSAATR